MHEIKNFIKNKTDVSLVFNPITVEYLTRVCVKNSDHSKSSANFANDER